MSHKASLSALIVILIGSCLLAGCASPLERAYSSARIHHGSQAAPRAYPQLLWSRDPDGDGKRLAQEGYVLIGTSSSDGAIDLSYTQDAVIQGKKVGAAIVLMKVELTTARHYMERPEGEGPIFFWDLTGTGISNLPIGTTGSVFASYWAKATDS